MCLNGDAPAQKRRPAGIPAWNAEPPGPIAALEYAMKDLHCRRIVRSYNLVILKRNGTSKIAETHRNHADRTSVN